MTRHPLAKFVTSHFKPRRYFLQKCIKATLKTRFYAFLTFFCKLFQQALNVFASETKSDVLIFLSLHLLSKQYLPAPYHFRFLGGKNTTVIIFLLFIFLDQYNSHYHSFSFSLSFSLSLSLFIIIITLPLSYHYY